MTTVSKTECPGVYFREGEGRKRIREDGSKDKCFCIRYSQNGKWHFETIGWESDGVTLEKAVAVRDVRLREYEGQPRAHTAPVVDADSGMKRIKAGPVGIYMRQSTHRVCQDGSPDVCYDILYSTNGRMKFEKIGWISEGYTIDDAVIVRGKRIKALRHPDLCPEEAVKICGPTMDMVWEVYKQRWLPNLKASHAEAIYRNYIQPVFGNRAVAGIHAYEVDEFKQMLLRREMQPSGKPLQPGTVRNIISTMRRIINKGKEWGLTQSKNPASGIHVVGAERNRERFLTPEEAAKLLDGLQFISCDLYFIVKIALHTGLRLSEVLGLKRQDIELSSCTVQVDGKTGKRSGYFPETLREEIKKILPKNPSDFLFTNAAGNPYNPKRISDKFSKIANDMGFNAGVSDSLQRIVFHSLRHTFCSWLAMRGVPLYTIGLLVGHSSVDMTQRYAKLSPDNKRQALRFIDDTLQQN